ncbi:phosphopantothenoylcysteine decarboxylase [Arcobacter sp. 31_11_sub10_T18]|nr:phosphopantothenoylcysteine decarboxylase [Arcobacter sp. 31_11_sub10_T18]
MMLSGKNILIGVTGSIAIYKTLDLIRLFIKANANVKVIMSESAKKFVTPLTFETISQQTILDEGNESWDKGSINNHIDIGKWADLFIIAPASANTINKLSNGIADNLLTQTALAYIKTKVIAPAANTNMIQNPITVQSLQKLSALGYKIVSSQIKELACKDIGDGALAQPSEIFCSSVQELLKDDYWENREVVVSGGGTVEKIDDVRYISNFSSGKMAASLSLALFFKGAKVTLVASRGYENLPLDIKIVPVNSSLEMLAALEQSLKVATDKTKIVQKPFLFMAAAVSDYLPALENEGKLKKDTIGKTWDLALIQNKDILSGLDKTKIYTIGFKAEMDKFSANQSAQNMVKTKNLDAVCLNIIDENNPFGSDNNIIELIINNVQEIKELKGDKFDISLKLLDKLKNEFEKLEN